MQLHFIAGLTFFPLVFLSLVVAVTLPSTVTRARRLSSRDDGTGIQATSPFDHTWIEKFTALGDSYGVGLGAGHSIKAARGLKLNTDCYQFSYGYPNILNADGMLGSNGNRVLEYLGCSGAKVPDIKDKQVPMMSEAQLVTLSAGGNDALLSDILNYCIFGWWTPYPYVPWIWNCQKQLDLAKKTIADDDYQNNLNSLVDAIKPKLSGDTSRLYWVGYEHFWSTETDECDKVTWSLSKNLGNRQFLTLDHRQQMNKLVDDVNDMIKSACSAWDKCVFVDANSDVDTLMGHYCEAGVDESYHWSVGGSYGNGMNREETWFYEWSTDKDDDTGPEKGDDQPQKRSIEPHKHITRPDLSKRNDEPKFEYNNATFEAQVAWYISKGLQDGAMDATEVKGAIGDNFTAFGSALPDSYGRIFHHDKYANGVLARRILDAMDVEQGKMMHQPPTTSTISNCPEKAKTTPPPQPPSTTTCTGNQVEGNCVMGHLPTGAPDSGPAQPVCNKVGSQGFVRIDKDKANSAASQYCSNLISDGVVLDANSSPPNPGTVDGGAEDGGLLSMAVLFDVTFCDQGTSQDDQKVDFGSMSQEDCWNNFFTTLTQYCSEDSTWQDYKPPYTFFGGTYGYKCGMWSVSGTSLS